MNLFRAHLTRAAGGAIIPGALSVTAVESSSPTAGGLSLSSTTGGDGRPTLAVASVTAAPTNARNTVFASATSPAVVRQSSASMLGRAATAWANALALIWLLSVL